MDEQQKNQPTETMAPGSVITPQSSGTLKISHNNTGGEQQLQQPQTQSQQPISPVVEAQSSALVPKEQPPQNPEEARVPTQEPAEPEGQQWQYQSGNLTPSVDYGADNQQSESDLQNDESIRWDASEFISHEKGGSWYLLLAAAVVVLAGIIYLVTRDIFSVVVVCLVAIVLGVIAGMKPRVLTYGIDSKGVQVGDKHFGFDAFRSFSVIDDLAVPSIQLLPQKRFMVPITLYFGPQDANKIVEFLGNYLPFEHRKSDFVDRLSSKLHF